MAFVMRNTVIVVPCYNEALRLDVEQFTGFLKPRGGVQIVFVDDGSTDATGALLQEVARCCPRQVQIRRLPQNSGKAEAVRQGMLLGLTLPDVEYIGYWDADLATPLRAIMEFRELLGETRALLVMGSRMRRLGSQVHRHPLRHLFGRIWATAASLTLDLPVYDSQCGAKLFRNLPIVAAIFAEPFIVNWSFDVEILARMIRFHRQGGPDPLTSVVEFPVEEWRDVPGSKVTPLDFFRGLVELNRIRRTLAR